MRRFIKELEKDNYQLVEIDNMNYLLYKIYEVENNPRVQQFIVQNWSQEDIEKLIKDFFFEVTDFEEAVLEFLYGINNKQHHTYREAAIEFDVKLIKIYDAEDMAFKRIRSSHTFKHSHISNKIKEFQNTIHKHPFNFKEKILEDFNHLIFRSFLEKETLLFKILERHHIVIDHINHNTSLGHSLIDLDLSKESYEGLIKENIHYYYQFINLTETKLNEINQSNNIKIDVHEILEKKKRILDKQKAQSDRVIVSLDIHRDGEITKCRYIYNLNLFSKISECLLEELFVETDKSLFNENVTYFSTDVNHYLLKLGYIDVNEAMKDCDLLDQDLYDSGITNDKHYMRNQFNEYTESYAKLYEISNEDN